MRRGVTAPTALRITRAVLGFLLVLIGLGLLFVCITDAVPLATIENKDGDGQTAWPSRVVLFIGAIIFIFVGLIGAFDD